VDLRDLTVGSRLLVINSRKTNVPRLERAEIQWTALVTTDLHAPGIASPTPFDRRKSMSLVGDNGANLARSMRRREVIHQCRPSPIASAGGRCFSLAL